MGFIRGALLVLISTLLFIGLLLSNLFLTVNWSLEHQTLYPELQGVAKNTLQEYDLIPEINSNFENLELYCYDHETYTFNSGEYSFKIPCEIIKQGANETIDYSVGTFINDTYYKDYECKILDCIKTSNQPFVLISEKTKDYFQQKFKITIIISLILFLLFFFISDKKYSALMTSGIIVALSALPLKALKWTSSLFDDSIVFELIGIFFSRANNVFLMMIIIGIVLFLGGLSWGVIKYGLKISGWFKKKSKDPEEKEKESETRDENSEKKETEFYINKKIKELRDKLKIIKKKKKQSVQEIEDKPKENTKKENRSKEELNKK